MTLSVQLYTMIAMVLMGLWIGVAVDTYGRFMHPRRPTWLLFLSDVLFWIVQGLLVFYVLLQVNEGDIRFYIFVALLCGFAAYRALFQNVYKRLLEAVIRLINALIRFIKGFILHFIVKPVKMLVKLIMTLVIFIGNALLAVLLFAMKLIFIPLKWIFRPISRLFSSLVPDSVKNLCEKVAGFFKIVQNKIKKWFDRT